MSLMVGQAASLVLQRHLQAHTNKIDKLLEQLITGYRINSAGDDPTGIALVNKYESQIRGYNKAYENVQQGLSILDTTEAGLSSILTELQNFRNTALEAAGDGISDYTPYTTAATAHLNAINLTSNTTSFNGTNLLDGSISGSFNIHAGPGSSANNQIDISNALNGDFDSTALAVNSVDLSTQNGALSAVDRIDDAIEIVLNKLTVVGTFQNLMANRGDLLSTQSINMQSAQNSIRNVDTVTATAELSKYEALQSAAATSLLKANSQANLLSLLYG